MGFTPGFLNCKISRTPPRPALSPVITVSFLHMIILTRISFKTFFEIIGFAVYTFANISENDR
jgi:hypothetical protein